MNSNRKIHHQIGTTGRAECGQALRLNHASGLDHLAESAAGLIAWLEQYGAADTCGLCVRSAVGALRRRGRDVPTWASDDVQFNRRVWADGAWPTPAEEAAITEEATR
jgi:hypothetical protein